MATPDTHSIGSSTPTASDDLVEKYRETARQLEAALATETDAKVIASLSTTLNRTHWHIGQLTGEAQLTEAKIVRSDAWKNILTRLEQILAKHPEAATELAAYFESLER